MAKLGVSFAGVLAGLEQTLGRLGLGALLTQKPSLLFNQAQCQYFRLGLLTSPMGPRCELPESLDGRRVIVSERSSVRLENCALEGNGALVVSSESEHPRQGATDFQGADILASEMLSVLTERLLERVFSL